MTDTVTVVTSPSTDIVEVVSVGPQGPQGPQGVKGDVGDVNPQMLTLRDAAAASATAAAGSASSASSSSSTATTQASAASASASTATSQATIATNQATTATTKAGEASTSATNAAASASAAASSATTATTKASEAATSAGNASGSASTAISQATIATTKASEADASATAAAGSASSASASASTAGTHASNAANSQSTATSAAATATSAATSASNSATTATTKANDAANSATNAQNAATTADTKANLAIASANAAAASQAAAAVSASGASTGAATATAKASEAASSAAAIEATFGNAASVASLAQTAQSAASLAQGYALSASSVVQQDLSGVTAQALHRSPNAITALHIYDTSKDSDGGAWTEKCQHTSWWNETLYGKWLAAADNEFYARNYGSNLGPERLTNGNFSDGSAGWTLDTGWAVSGGFATKTGAVSAGVYRPVSLTLGKTYAVTYTVSGSTAGVICACLVGGTQTNGLLKSGNGTRTEYLVAATGNVSAGVTANGAFTGSVTNISVREVTALNTASGDYFQLTTDGKFYRLWKNLLSQSAFANGVTDAPVRGGLLTATTFAGVSSNTGLSFGHNGTTDTYAYKSNIAAVNTTYTISAYVRMTDGNAPAFGSASGLNSANDFMFVIGGSVVTPTTNVVENLGGGLYRVSGTLTTASTIGANNTGISKGGAHSNRTFTTSGWQVELGSTVTTYEAKAAEGSTSEVFRGNKADFPKQAAIVAEAGNVTVYDLTEPGRPMWMRFIAANTNHLLRNTGVGSNTMNNGQLVVSTASAYSSLSLFQISFPADSTIARNTAGNYLYNGDISTRNSTLLGYNFIASGSPQNIASSTVNAVAMTVLPDAPIDPATGLRVPTIAVATPSGLSVINDTGVVRNDTSIGCNVVAFDASGAVYFCRDTFNLNFKLALPSAYRTTTNFGVTFAFGGIPLSANTVAANVGPFITPVGRSRLVGRAATASAATRLGAGHYRIDQARPDRSLTTHITNAYNTGWMTGDIRRCYLSDATAGSFTGPELATSTSWTLPTGWNFSGGVLSYNGTGSINSRAYLPVSLASTRTFRVTSTVSSRTGGGSIVVGCGDATASATISSATVSVGTGDKISIFYLNASAASVFFQVVTDATQTFSISGLSVTEVDADRSYKAAGASINGTLTKAQLASGTSLVGYSGFSASNYLREPYSADLDFGTGEWTASAWVNVPATLPVSSFPVIGSNVLANPSFDSGSTGWTVSGEDATHIVTFSSGTLRYQSSTTTPVLNIQQSNVLTIGKTYLLEVTVSAWTSGSIKTDAFGTTLILASSAASVGSRQFLVVASSTTFAINRNSADVDTTIDNISIREIGAAVIADRAFSSGARFRLGVTGTGLLTAEAFDGTTTRTVTTTATYNNAQWLKARVNYTTDGSLAILVNGREVAVTRGNPLLTLNNSSAPLTIGNSFALDAPFPGSIALLKLGATVPTPEQAQFMYEQEKQLFRAGALSVLPDINTIVDVAYDDATDRWVASSSGNESYWTGLVRNSVTPVPAGSYTKIIANSGIELAARSTTNPGVDVTIPAYGLREELVRRAEAAARLSKELAVYDYVGGFTGNTTNGSTAIASASTITYPGSYIGARISGSGIPANTTITGVSGTTIYISAAATATATGVSITFLDFELPVGMEAKTVMVAGSVKQEGATKDFTRLYDGFIETIRFGAAPGVTAWVQIQAQRITLQ